MKTLPTPDEITRMSDFQRESGEAETADMIDALAAEVKRLTGVVSGADAALAHRAERIRGLLAGPDHAAHDRRVTELLEANNREVERRRAAEGDLEKLATKLAFARDATHLIDRFYEVMSKGFMCCVSGDGDPRVAISYRSLNGAHELNTLLIEMGMWAKARRAEKVPA